MFQRSLADAYHTIRFLRLIIGNSQIIIKFQRIRSRFNTRLADFDNLLIIFFFCRSADQHHTGSFIGRVQVNHLFQDGNRLRLHLLGQQILRIKHWNLRVILFLLHDPVKQSDDLRTVLIGLFIFHNHLTHDAHFGIRSHLLIQQQCIQLLLVEFFLPCLFIVRSHREDSHRIIGFRRQHLLINVISLLFLAILKIYVSQDDLITHVHRIFLHQTFYFLKCFLVILHLEVDTKLLHGQLFILTHTLFQTV